MADSDKLWFDLGVRDNISKTLKDIMNRAEDVKKALSGIELGNAMKNLSESARAIDKIDQTIRKLQVARNNTSNNNERQRINEIISDLKKQRTEYNNLSKSVDALGEKGSAAFIKQKQGLDVALNAANRYIGTVNTLEDKIRNLSNIRISLASAISGAKKNSIDTTEAEKILGQIWNREMNARRSLNSGSAVSSNLTGSNYDNLISKAKELAKTLGVDVVNAERHVAQASDGLVSAYDRVLNASKNVNSLSKQIGMQIASTFSIYAIQGFVKNLITIGGEFEIQHKALQNILGDVEQANTLFAQLKGLAVESPFSFKQEVTYAKQLAAFNIPYKEIYDTTKRLGDLSAGLGVDMNRLILAYGQVRSAAVLRGQELRQFTEAGIPMVQALADEFTKLNGKVVTTGEVFSLISKRAVPFEMVKKVLWDMTNEGGRFYNMQFELADTLAGKWSNLRDAWEIMLSDFAKGTSTGGATLKMLVSWTTSLIKGLNQLSPVIWGVISAFSVLKTTKVLDNTLSFGYKNMQRNVIEAQRLNAIEINRKFILGEINQKERDNLLLKNANIRNSMNMLAITGRMTPLQMFRARQEGEIDRQYVQQAFHLGLINQNEYRAIQTGNARLMLQERITKAMSLGWGTWVSIGIMAGTTLYQAYTQWASGIEQQVEAAVNGARDRAKELAKIIEQNKAGVPDDREDLRNRVNQMRNVLEESDAYTQTIDDQLKRSKDLTEQYKILLKAIQDAKEQAEFTVDNKENIEAAIKASSTSFQLNKTNPIWGNLAELYKYVYNFTFDDDINANVKQYDEQVAAYENQKRAISTYRDEYVKAINDMKKESEGFSELVKNLSPEEALVKIVDSDYWEAFKKKMGSSADTFGKMAERLNSYSDGVTNHMDEIVSNDIPKMVEELAKQEGISVEEYKKNAQKYPIHTKMMITSIVSSLKEGSAAARAELLKALLDFFGLASEAAGAKNPVNDKYKIYRDETSQGRHVLGTLINGAKEKGWGDKNGNGIWDVKWINKYFGEGTGYVAGINAMISKWNELKEEREAAQRSGAKLSEAEESEWQRLSKAAEIYDFKSKKSKQFNSENGSKKDTELEGWKNRLKEIQEFWREYETLSKRMSDKEAVETIRKGGVFPSLFNDKGELLINVREGLSKVLRDFFNSTDANTLDREKFQNEILKLIFDVDNKAAEEAAKKFLDVTKETLQRQAEQWNLYEKVFNQTGNKSFAALAFKDGKLWDDQTESLKETLLQKMQANLNDGGTLELDFSISERTAEDYFKKNFKNAESLYTIWLEIVKLLRGNYTEALNNSASAMAESMTYANRIASVMAKYEKKIKEAQKIGNNDAAYAFEKARDAEVAIIQSEQLKDNLNWDAIFGNLEHYTKKVLVNVRKNLKDWIKLNRNKADVKTIKEMTEAVSRLNNVIGEKSGIFGGIKDAAEHLTQAKEEYTNAKNDYVDAVIRFGQDSIQAQDAKKRLNQSKQGLDQAEADTRKKIEIMIGKMASVANAFSSLGKGGKMSLSEMGSLVGNLITALSGTNTAIGNLIAAIFAILDSIGEQGLDVFVGNILDSVANAIGGIIKGYWNIGGSLIGMPEIGSWVDDYFGDGYKQYKEIKAEYEKLVAVWDSLISKKEQYLNMRWGVEAQNAADEALELMKKELEYTRYAASERLGAGASMGSHSQGYRMWNNDDWKSFAGDISKKLGGVKFESMVDMTKMTAEQLQWIKENYYYLWAQMDDDFKGYLEKIIEYGEKEKDIVEDLKEKLTGWNLDNVKKEWADLISTMDNSVDNLAENLEEKLKNAILNSMIDNLFTKRLQALIDSASQNDTYIDKYGNVKTHHYDANGNVTDTDVASEFTQGEYEWLINEGTSIAEDVTAVRDILKDIYGWTDSNSSSSSASNTIKGVTEQTADLIASYLNAIRADVSVNRVTLGQILIAVQGTAGLPVIAQSQLEQLRTLVQLAQQRTGFVSEIRDILHRASDGGNSIRIK